MAMAEMPPPQDAGAVPLAPDAVLAWVGAHAPHAFYSSRFAPFTTFPRDAIDEALWSLSRAGLVEVCDWQRGVGQGFRLTADGQKAERGHREPPAPAVAAEPIDDFAGEARRRLLEPSAPVLTPLIAVACIVWFAFGATIAIRSHGIVEYLLGNSDPVVAWILGRLGAVSGSSLLDGQPWRLIASGFVHVGVFHLLGNLVILSLLGRFAEAVWGTWRFALIYILSGLGGAIVTMALSPMEQDAGGALREVLIGGASGSLWGLTLATVAWLVRNLKHVPRDVGQDWIRKLGIVGLMNLMVSFYPGISNYCTLGGALTGLAVAVAVSRIRGRLAESLLAIGGLLAIVALLAGLLAAGMSWQEDWQEVKAHHAQRLRERAEREARKASDLPKRP